MGPASGLVDNFASPDGWDAFADATGFTGEKKDALGRRICYQGGKRVMVADFDSFSGGYCKPGERSDLTGCVPASGKGGGGRQPTKQGVRDHESTPPADPHDAWQARQDQRDAAREEFDTIDELYTPKVREAGDAATKVWADTEGAFDSEDTDAETLREAASDFVTARLTALDPVIEGLRKAGATDQELRPVRLARGKLGAQAGKLSSAYAASAARLEKTRWELHDLQESEPEDEGDEHDQWEEGVAGLEKQQQTLSARLPRQREALEALVNERFDTLDAEVNDAVINVRDRIEADEENDPEPD